MTTTPGEWERHVTLRCKRMSEHMYGPSHGRGPRLPVPCPDCYSIESVWRAIPYEPDGHNLIDGTLVVLHRNEFAVRPSTSHPLDNERVWLTAHGYTVLAAGPET